MITREGALRKYVEQYEIDVPENLVKNEIQYMTLAMKHGMQYDTLTGGRLHLNAKAELDAQADEIREAALYEVKSGLVLKSVVVEQKFIVTEEELEAEADAMAERQNSTVAMIKNFFGEDLSMLERDIKERKAVEWIFEHVRNKYGDDL